MSRNLIHWIKFLVSLDEIKDTAFYVVKCVIILLVSGKEIINSNNISPYL